MKKTINILLILLLTLCVFGCANNGGNNTAEGNDPSKQEETIKDEWLCTRITYYNTDGSIASYIVNTYDEDGRLLNNEEYNVNNELISTTKSTYDEKGRESEYVLYDAKGNIDITGVYEYDDQDRVIKETDYHGDGTVADYFTYEYDPNGNIIHSENKTEDEELSMKIDYEYNDQGEVAKTYYDFYGYDTWYYVFEYSNGVLVRRTMYNSKDEVDSVDVYEYSEKDPKLNESVESYDSNNKLKYRTEYRYDEYGNMISSAMFDPEGNMLTMTEYEFKKK